MTRHATAAVLRSPDPGEVRVPTLPRRGRGAGEWHELTKAWWRDMWASPMAAEFDKSDLHGLYMLARLVDDYWTAGDTKSRRETAQEVRLQSQRYGLSPMDRRRLQWEIERADDAQARGRRRKPTRSSSSRFPGPVQANGGRSTLGPSFARSPSTRAPANDAQGCPSGLGPSPEGAPSPAAQRQTGQETS